MKIILVFVFLFSGISACSETQIEDQTGEWRLVWYDEFDGTAIDESRWGYDVDCWGGGNNERQCYTKRHENAHVANGYLNIVAHIGETTGYALPEHLRNGQQDENEQVSRPFSSARLVSQADWRYGRFEIRAKLPTGQGVWPAIWMLPSENVYGGWAASGEIDIMEAINLGAVCLTCANGREDRIHGTLHYGDNWPYNVHKGSDFVPSETADGFHVFALEWHAGQIDWFVDGIHYQTQTSDTWYTLASPASDHAPFDQVFHLILNLAIGGRWPEENNEKGVSMTGFPKTMLIDWVRVYTCESDSDTAKACAGTG